MYTDYWQLDARPFDSSFDPRFYYPSETHQATLLKLLYAIDTRRSAALMAGPSGVGKTILAGLLSDELSDDKHSVVHIRFPQMSSAQLLAYLAEKLTREHASEAAVDVNIRRIEDALARSVDEERHTVVMLDEAHLLRDTDALETIRLLMNFESAWTLLLVAQPTLLPALDRMPDLEERLSVKCLLRRFNLDETISYISHRMVAAGATDLYRVFDTKALEAVHQLSDGIPRRVDRLCDLSLLIGYAEEATKLQASHVENVAAELSTTAMPKAA